MGKFMESMGMNTKGPKKEKPKEVPVAKAKAATKVVEEPKIAEVKTDPKAFKKI